MLTKFLEPQFVRMPDFAAGRWLNTPNPLTKEKLRGRAVLVDFWDYSCLNCLRTLPYIRNWFKRYREKGLAIIGVHSPEFNFAKGQKQVEAAIERLDIRYPVLLDNEFQTWDRYAAHAWPTKYLIDHQGYIRYTRRGEGYYLETEKAIQALLRARDPAVTLPDPLPPLREEDAPGAVCYRPSPELHTGYRGGGLFGGALGNPEGYITGSVMAYTMPEEEEREEGQFYLAGFWNAEPEAVSFAGQDGGKVVVPYQAAGVNAVLAPTSDPVAMMLDLLPDDWEPVVEIRQDGRPLDPAWAGADVLVDDRGISTVIVTQPRLYELVRNIGYERHELELTFRANGLALYSITFSTCLAAGHGAGDETTVTR